MTLPLRPLAIGLVLAGCAHSQARQAEVPPAATPASPPTANVKQPSPAPALQPVDFTRDVRPILESRCQPCHFPGGRMYQPLPFDRAETIYTLGTKLFTRIKAENEQAVIRQFLSQPR